jgi:molybdate transport system permease protein
MAYDWFPVWLSLRTATTAMLVVIPLGIGLALLQARRRYPLRRLVDALILLPLVLPPSVVGFFLVVVLGRRGPVGELLERWLDLRLLFTPAGAAVASAIVALPILVKTAQPALEAVPLDLERIGRSLGLSPLQLIFRVTLRVAWRGVLAGIVLAFARAMGEFGATLMVAGNIPGLTNTMPLEIYAAYERGDDATALGYVLVLTLLSLAVVLGSSWLSRDEQGPR